jgi:antitoxin component YwqK of YwqJK toxin-antitoxin module
MSDITPELLEQIRLAQKKPQPIEDTSPEKPALSQTPDPSLVVHEIKNHDGKVIQKIPLKNGVIDGILEVFDEKGNLRQSIPYENNLTQGTMMGYDDLGNILYEIPFKDGKKEGLGTFYMNGTKSSDITFQNDQMDGSFTAYHGNGAISMQVTYKESHMDGELSAFNERGTLVKKETYAMGKKNGPSQTFYPSGNLYEEATFENNIPINQSTTYHENQKPMTIKHYKEGKIVLTETYDDNGGLKKKEAGTNG